MLGGWQILRSFLAGMPNRMLGEQPGRTRDREPGPLSPRVAIVALVGDQERNVLTSVSTREEWDLHLVESSEIAWAISNQLAAPVILCDRDWPSAEWRALVQNLASSPHHPCVILTSTVADDYLWEELIRQGGYDVLAKPLRADDVVRLIKLALSYWKSVASAVRPEHVPSRCEGS